MSFNKNWLIGATLILSLVALGVATFKSVSVELTGTQLNELALKVQEGFLGASGTRFPNGLSTDSTSPSAGQIRTTTFLSTGTTTVTESVDGHVVGGTMSTAATGTVRVIYTNTTGPKICDASVGNLYANNNGSFSPSVVFSMGTTTGATISSTNLIASSTMATSTDSIFQTSSGSFILDNGHVITGIMGDIVNTQASSTYFGNITAEFGVWCQDLSI